MSRDLQRLLADVHRVIGVIDNPDGWKTKEDDPFTMDDSTTLKIVRSIFMSGNWTNHPDYPKEPTQ